MVSMSVLHEAPRFLLFEDPDGETGMAVYRLGKWRGINRFRGYTLEKRRSKRPYLSAGKVRIPVTVVAEVEGVQHGL